MGKGRSLSICIVLFLVVALLVGCGGRQATPQAEKPQAQPVGHLAANATVETVAGTGEPGLADGPALEAQFNWPVDVAVDGEGNIYVSDRENRRIAKITPDGTVTTITGGNPIGDTDGSLEEARFATPWGILLGPEGQIYVADTDNAKLRVVLPQEGRVETVTDRFHAYQMAFDSEGNILAGWGLDRQTVIRLNLETKERQTVAGSGSAGYRDGPAGEARFSFVSGIGVDAEGNIFVSEGVNVRLLAGSHLIRKIAPDGQVTTVAGAYTQAGYRDGKGDQARFKYPVDLVVDAQGVLYVADAGNNCIRQITPDGTVTTLAGVCGEPGDLVDGPAAQARFKNPQGLAFDRDGSLLVADTLNHCIRRIVFQ